MEFADDFQNVIDSYLGSHKDLAVTRLLNASMNLIDAEWDESMRDALIKGVKLAKNEGGITEDLANGIRGYI
jgi:hypothetical protein